MASARATSSLTSRPGSVTAAPGRADDDSTIARSRLNSTLIAPPTTGAPSIDCTKLTVRRSPALPWTTSAASCQCAALVPGASRPSCASTMRRAAASAAAGLALAPGAAMPSPQMRAGTPVDASHSPCHDPYAVVNAFHAASPAAVGRGWVIRTRRAGSPAATSSGRSAR